MIFWQWEQMVGLKQPPKSQDRRPKFPYELARQLWKHGWSYLVDLKYNPVTDSALAEANRILAENVITLSVCPPGRGKKAVGRTPPIKAIRRELLVGISNYDCLKEGIFRRNDYARDLQGFSHLGSQDVFTTPKYAFLDLWNSIYRKPHSWQDSPRVWVLEFECLKSPPSA